MLYSKLQKLVQQTKRPDGGADVKLPKDVFDRLLRAALAGSHFDEEWYLKANPDVAAAVRARKVESGHTHYINTGYFEGRLPYEIDVDEEYYFEKNDDVKRAARARKLRSAKEHWYSNGIKEGRDPSENFTLFAAFLDAVAVPMLLGALDLFGAGGTFYVVVSAEIIFLIDVDLIGQPAFVIAGADVMLPARSDFPASHCGSDIGIGLQIPFFVKVRARQGSAQKPVEDILRQLHLCATIRLPGLLNKFLQVRI
jgi:hypothetical protein